MDVTNRRQVSLIAKDRRVALGLSQQVVADRAGVSRKWVSDFELGRGESEVSPMLRLIAALELRMTLAPFDQPVNGASAANDAFDLGAIIDDHRAFRGDGRDR